jgi:DNA-binding response OmpR family regulator
MNARDFGAMAQVLLIEPDNLVRGTVASVCRDMELVRIIQATRISQAEALLQSAPLQGVILSLADCDAALDLLERLREGAFVCGAATPVVVLASACAKEQAVRLKALSVQRLLLQPFRLRDVLHTVEQLWPAPAACAQPAAGASAVR